MPINRKRMAAIIIALKKRGLWRELTQTRKKALRVLKTSSSGPFKKSLIKFHGKVLPFLTSEEFAKSPVAKVLTPAVVKQAVSKMSVGHFSQTNIKSINLLDDVGFRHVLTSSVVHSPHLSKEEVMGTLQVIGGGTIFGGRVAGVHLRGRIFINGGEIEKVVNTQIAGELKQMKKLKQSLPSSEEIREISETAYKELFSDVILHETIHNFDSPKVSTGIRQPGRSAAPDFLRAQGLGENWGELSTADRTRAVEDFVSNYSYYLEEYKWFERDYPESYAVMRRIFEEGK